MSGFDRLGRAWRYGAIGILTNCGCYLLFLLLMDVGVRTVAANALCYGAGLLLAYAANRCWTFRSESRHTYDIIRFAAAHAVGLTLSIATIAGLLHVMRPPLAQIGAVAVAAVAIFMTLELLGFARPAKHHGGADK